MDSSIDRKNIIAVKCKAEGFDAVGFAPASLSTEVASNISAYLSAGHHGEMSWLAERLEWRANPKKLWPDAQSIIILGQNYAPEDNPLLKLNNKAIGNISCYALNNDYHDIIKKKLKKIASWLAQEYSCEVKVFVDTAPVMEKPLATTAGLGWQGKHTCLVSREFGNWLFLGAIFTTIPLTPDKPQKDLCGSCTRCLDICSTNAFIAPRQIDARRCISYLTIESKEQIPIEFRKAIGNRIYGCDDCLAICPWNSFAKISKEASYHPREELKSPLLADLVRLNDAEFRALFRKSPVKRIGRARFVRNVLVAIGNSEDSKLAAEVIPLLDDESPLVSEMAAWALSEISNT